MVPTKDVFTYLGAIGGSYLSSLWNFPGTFLDVQVSDFFLRSDEKWRSSSHLRNSGLTMQLLYKFIVKLEIEYMRI